MKSAIITINDYDNYGNRLQNYAMQKALENVGCDVDTIDFQDGISKSVNFNVWLYNLFNYKKAPQRRFRLFKRFTKDNINVIKKNSKSVNTNNYDLFVCGSDQIWNPDFAGFDYYFGGFVPKNKLFSYAASFGVDSIDGDYRKKCKKLLERFSAISVRENSGAFIINEITNQNAICNVDPTLLMEKNDWKLLEKKPNYNVPSKYICVYTLGEQSDEVKNYINELSLSLNCEVISLKDKDRNGIWYATGPSEFLWLIDHSYAVITDSFHGTVFSVIFNKPVVISNRIDSRKSMGSRIDSLLSVLDLKGRRMEELQIENVMAYDYSNCYKNIQTQKEISYNYLKKIIISKR